MRKKIWASAHAPLPEQGSDFVLLSKLGEEGAAIQSQLNNTPADAGELRSLAERLLELASKNDASLYQPGGSPAFQFVLGEMAKDYNVGIYYAHSVRESKEEKLPDGSIKKTAIFKHQCWIKTI